MNRKFAVVLGLLLLPAAAAAQTATQPTYNPDQDNTRFGGTSAVFLTLPADARGAALGGAVAAVATDLTSMFYNPAGLAQMGTTQAMFSYTPYIADTHHITAGLGWSLRGGEWGLGVSLMNFGFGDTPVYTEDQQDGNGQTYSVSNTAIGLTTAFQFSDRFSAGITGRFVSEQLGRTDAHGFTVDFGTSYHAELSGRPIRASFVIMNYGPPLRHSGAVLNNQVDAIDNSMNVEDQPVELRTTSFDPPTQFRFGLAYDLMSTTANRLTVLGEFSQPNDSKPGVGGGAEFSATLGGGLTAALRGSYSYQADNNLDVSSTFSQQAFAPSGNNEGLDGLSAGAGLGFKVGANGMVSLDYAFRHLGDLGTTNMFSIKLGW